MRILLIDNYDSFAQSICHLLIQTGAEVILHHCDTVSVDEALQLDCDLIVLGPGPGTPKDAGIMLPLAVKAVGKIPLLGICLGHQVINEVFGGKTQRAKKPFHGKSSLIYHTNSGIFQGLPKPVPMMRYHSLVVSPAPSLNITAWNDQQEVMGLSHPLHPIETIQFHPESALSPYGFQLIKNYLNQLTLTRI